MPIERDQAASLLEALVSLVRETRAIAHRDAARSVAATPIAILKLVSESDPRLGDLANKLRVKPSVASRAVAALEHEGYVARMADPDDARACRIRITETGREHLEHREGWALDVIARTLADWSPEDAEQSVRVLRRLEDSVSEWVAHFDDVVANGTDPLTSSMGTTPSTNTAPTNSALTDQPTDSIADNDVSQQKPQQRHHVALPRTTWETTAV
jgi:DNA-binding MarR family transcriptional regulator